VSFAFCSTNIVFAGPLFDFVFGFFAFLSLSPNSRTSQSLQSSFHDSGQLGLVHNLDKAALMAPSDLFETFPPPRIRVAILNLRWPEMRLRAPVQNTAPRRMRSITATYNAFSMIRAKCRPISCSFRSLHVALTCRRARLRLADVELSPPRFLSNKQDPIPMEMSHD